jgi:hypothetical protein
MRSLSRRTKRSPSLRYKAGIALASTVITGLIATPAGASWLAPVDLSAPGGHVGRVQVGMDRRGDAVAVWEAFNGADWVIQGSVRPVATGVWQTPVDLSAESEDAESPRLAVDADGDAVAVWDVRTLTSSVVQSARRPAGSGAWQATVDVSTGAELASAPDVALDARGDAVAVWQRYTETVEGTRQSAAASSIRPALAVSWHAPVRISAEGVSVGQTRVATDLRGDVAAVWSALPAGANSSIIQAAVRPLLAATWHAPTAVSVPAEEGANALTPQVALDRAGDVTALWVRESVLKSATRPVTSGTWTAPTDVSDEGESALSEDIGFAVSPAGEAFAAWGSGGAGGISSLQSAVRPTAGGSWQKPVAVVVEPKGTSVTDPNLAIDPIGNAVAVWRVESGRFTTFKGFIQSAARPAATAVWGAPVDLTAESEDARRPRVALSPTGRAVAAWEHVSVGTSDLIQSSFYEP